MAKPNGEKLKIDQHFAKLLTKNILVFCDSHCIVYIDDISDVVSTRVTVKLVADTKFYSVFIDTLTPACLQSCLTTTSDWSNHWQLNLSRTKCHVLQVAPAKASCADKNFPYHIDNVALTS